MQENKSVAACFHMLLRAFVAWALVHSRLVSMPKVLLPSPSIRSPETRRMAQRDGRIGLPEISIHPFPMIAKYFNTSSCLKLEPITQEMEL